MVTPPPASSTFVYSKGAQSWIKDPEIDAWYEQQAVSVTAQKRQALLHKIQQKVYDEARFMPDLGARLSVCLGATGGGVRAEFDSVICVFWTL